MSRYLRNNTATRTTVGPFLSAADGITPKTSLTATNEHLTFIVDDGGVPTLVLDANATASGGNNDFVHITNDDAGMYDLELTAAQTNYLGRAMLSVNYVTDHCPVFHEFTILPQQVYDSMILGSDVLDVSAIQFAGQTITAAAGVTLPTSVASPTNITAASGVSLAADQAVNVTKWNGTTVATPATAGIPDVNMKNIANAAVSTSTAQLGVNAVNVGGTSQTGRDLGATLGVAGAGLTAVPWNTAWATPAQAVVNAEVVLQNLDHLCKTATAAADMTAEVVDGSILSRIVSDSDTSTYNPSVASLAAINNTVGNEIADLGTMLSYIEGYISSDDGLIRVSAVNPFMGTDNKLLISADAQDLSATLSVNAKLLNGSTPNNASDVDTAGLLTTIKFLALK